MKKSPFQKNHCVLLIFSVILPVILLAAPAMAADDMPTPSTQPITHGLRIFTCAHSFHVFTPPILEEMAHSAGITDQKYVGTSMIGGSRVIQHWEIPDAGNQAKQALTAGEVDVLTLSPIWLPDDGIEKFAKLAFEHNPNIRVTVQEFWLPNDTFDPVYPLKVGIPVDHNAATFEELEKQNALYVQGMNALIRDLNKQLGKEVLFAVPAGAATDALREQIIKGQAPGLTTQAELFTDSWGHPQPALQTLATYCHYAVIYRRNPVGLPVPKILLAQPNLPPDKAEALNLLLQKLAWNAVVSEPLSGVSGSKYEL